MTAGKAQYDGHSDWYDETISAWSTTEETDFLREHLGAGGMEICLDVACGTGRFGPVIADAGHRLVGFDVSADEGD
jgi:predicted TPR repeat methyltransferase